MNLGVFCVTLILRAAITFPCFGSPMTTGYRPANYPPFLLQKRSLSRAHTRALPALWIGSPPRRLHPIWGLNLEHNWNSLQKSCQKITKNNIDPCFIRAISYNYSESSIVTLWHNCALYVSRCTLILISHSNTDNQAMHKLSASKETCFHLGVCVRLF